MAILRLSHITFDLKKKQTMSRSPRFGRAYCNECGEMGPIDCKDKRTGYLYRKGNQIYRKSVVIEEETKVVVRLFFWLLSGNLQSSMTLPASSSQPDYYPIPSGHSALCIILHLRQLTKLTNN